MKPYITIPLIAFAMAITACNDKEVENDTSGSPLDTFYTENSPGDITQISKAFEEPTPGKEIVIAGEVMGRANPFVEGRAMVTLGDPTKITPCNRIPGDSCPTPWDVCCDAPEVIKNSITTIQFLDEEGKIIKSDLKGYKGIKELSYLTVKGTIAEGSNSENLLINALAFHVTDPSPYKDAEPVGHHSDHDHGEAGGSVTDDDGVFIYTKEPAKQE